MAEKKEEVNEQESANEWETEDEWDDQGAVRITRKPKTQPNRNNKPRKKRSKGYRGTGIFDPDIISSFNPYSRGNWDELLSHGMKPWDDDAEDALMALRGFHVDDMSSEHSSGSVPWEYRL